MDTTYFLPLFGFLIGFLIVSIGGGGGAFYVGVLTAVYNVSPPVAASVSLATMIPSTIIGGYSHYKSGNVHVKLAMTMLLFGAAGTVVSSFFAHSFPITYYQIAFAVFMIHMGIKTTRSYMRRRSNFQKELKDINSRSALYIAAGYGIVAGLMSGLLGASGGGALTTGLIVMGCEAFAVAGTSVVAIMGIVVTGVIVHSSLGNVDWTLAGLLAAGSVPGAMLGPMLLRKIDQKKFEAFIIPFVIVTSFLMGGVILYRVFR